MSPKNNQNNLFVLQETIVWMGSLWWVSLVVNEQLANAIQEERKQAVKSWVNKQHAPINTKPVLLQPYMRRTR